jgi:hypothetical protein
VDSQASGVASCTCSTYRKIDQHKLKLSLVCNLRLHNILCWFVPQQTCSRLTLLLGSLGYSLYIRSYLIMEIHPNAGGLVIAASSILGTAFCPMWKSEVLTPSSRYLHRLVMDGTWCFGPRLSHRVDKWPLHIYLPVCIQCGGSNRSIHNSWAKIIFETNRVGSGTYIAFLILTSSARCYRTSLPTPTKVAYPSPPVFLQFLNVTDQKAS